MNLKKITASLLTTTALAASPVAALAQSSTPTRVSQCNQIIAIVNEAVSKTKEVTDNGQASNPDALLGAAEAMNLAATQLETISITDSTLQGYQSQFASMYRETSQATRDFVVAYQARNRTEAESALQRLQASTNPEKQLVVNINNYCTR